MFGTADSALPSNVAAIFDSVLKVLNSEHEQNNTLPEPFRSAVIGGINCDMLPGAKGEFGRAPTNPIPVNGPLGEILYLSRLRTNPGWKRLWSPGSPLMFHRVRAEDGLEGAVDVFEVLSLDGRMREKLFLSMYHPRKSHSAPTGYAIAPKLDSDNLTYGVNHVVERFPQRLDAYIRQWQMDMLGIPLPVHRVREAVNGSRFKPSFIGDIEQHRPDQLDAQLHEDVLKLLHARNDPRFEGKAVAIGTDGLVRPFPAQPIPSQSQVGPAEPSRTVSRWASKEARSGTCMSSASHDLVWSQIVVEAGEATGDRLWCALIREIAKIAVERSGEDPEVDELDESWSYSVEQTILDWQNESLPYSSDLSLILGELDYFQNLDIPWDERFTLSGRICFDPSIVWDIRGVLDDYPEARDAVTDELVEDFYSDWRTAFLLRILEEVKSLNDDADKVGAQPPRMDDLMPNLTAYGVADIIRKADNADEALSSDGSDPKRTSVDTSAKQSQRVDRIRAFMKDLKERKPPPASARIEPYGPK